MKNKETSYYRKNILDLQQLLVLYPFLLLIGKIVRWTIMRGTLLNMSKGWGYVDPIMHGEWSFQLFGAEELAEGDIGQGDNIYTVLRIFWYLWLKIPTDFVSFEMAITITWGIFLLLVLMGCRRYVTMSEGIYLALGVIVNSVYCFCLGKEVYQMLFFFLLYFVLRSGQIPGKMKVVLSGLIILLSVTLFRTYYALIFIFAGIFCLVVWTDKNTFRKSLKKKLSWKFILKVFLAMGLGYLILLRIFWSASPGLFNRFRDALLLASDATSSSNTYMENILSEHGNNIILITLEYMFAVLRMMFPVELVVLGPKYWFYILYQIIVTLGMIKSVRNWNQNTVEQKIATTLFVGFMFMSATFEVDFGAWIRHGAVTMPMVLIMMGICGRKPLVEVQSKHYFMEKD